MGLVHVLVAVLIGVVIWRVSMWFVRMLSTPPPEIDPDDVVATSQRYRCTVCGTEVTMTVQNVQEDAPPKHCREEMVPVSDI